MNKTEFVAEVAAKSGQTKTLTSTLLDAIVGTIGASLKRGEQVTIAGFGTFQVRHRAARNGRNPSTGEIVRLAASKSAAFKPAKALKDAL